MITFKGGAQAGSLTRDNKGRKPLEQVEQDSRGDEAVRQQQ